MRNLAVAGCLLFVGTFASSAYAQSSSDQLIAAADRAHNFGTVARAAKTEHQFEIRNPFQQPLHLRSVRASCGCTTPIIETEWIKPGETGTVLARFNTGTFTGDRKATLTVTIDQPSYMELQLNVKGYIRSDIVFSPGELAFGNTPAGEMKQIEATLDYAGKSDWQITKITSDSKYVSGDFKEVSRGNGRVKYLLTALLSPECPTGSLETQLILHTNDMRLTTVPLACFGEIQADLSASPNTFALGNLKPGQPTKQRILLKGNEPFNIVTVKGANIEVEYEAASEAKAAQFLNLTFTPSKTAGIGDNQATIEIRTDLAGEKAIEIGMTYRIESATASSTGSGDSSTSLIRTVPQFSDPLYE